MQIASFLAHYQLVYINFDLSSFFLISCMVTVALSAFKCGSFANSKSPNGKMDRLFGCSKAGFRFWMDRFGGSIFVNIIRHCAAFCGDTFHQIMMGV
jgi:hypothetical protein